MCWLRHAGRPQVAGKGQAGQESRGRRQDLEHHAKEIGFYSEDQRF